MTDCDAHDPSSTPLSEGPSQSGRPTHLLLEDRKEAFGQYLRRVRHKSGLTLREAAVRFDVHFVYLQRLETGKGPRLLKMDWLERISTVYARPLVEVLHAAGLVDKLPDELHPVYQIEDQFEQLVTHPALAPYGLDHRAIAFYSLPQKQQWLEFARKLEQHVISGGPTVDEVLGRSTG